MAKTVGSVHLNTEKAIDHRLFKLKIGTTNKNNPLVVYLEGKTFITPTIEKETYRKDISLIEHGFKNNIREMINKTPYFIDKYILDFQISDAAISVKKKSFLSFELLLKQNTETILPLKEIRKRTETDICSMINGLEETIKLHDFKLSKTKK